MCVTQLTGPGSRSKPSGAGSIATPSTSHDPPLRLARPLRCNSWRGGSPRPVTVARRTEWTRRAAEAGDTMAVQLYAKRLDEDGDRDGADAILGTAAAAGDTSALLSLAARLDEAGKTEDAERLLVQGAEAGDTVVMERLAARLDEAGRRDDAKGGCAEPQKPATPLPCSSSRRGSTRTASRRKPKGGWSEQQRRMTISRTS